MNYDELASKVWTIYVHYIVIDGKKLPLDPPIEFRYWWDPNRALVNIEGTGVFKEILVYGANLNNAFHTLHREILPMWYNDTKDTESKFTKKAQAIINGLKKRLENDIGK